MHQLLAEELPSNGDMCGCCAKACVITGSTPVPSRLGQGQMQHMPRSRKQSRASPPPGPLRISPPHLSVSPTLRPSSSLLNLHIHAQNAGTLGPTIPSPLSQDPTLGSSASSMSDIDMNEGILIQDSDHKEDTVETDDVTVTGLIEQSGPTEENKKILRDQLRKTLNQSKSG